MTISLLLLLGGRLERRHGVLPFPRLLVAGQRGLRHTIQYKHYTIQYNIIYDYVCIHIYIYTYVYMYIVVYWQRDSAAFAEAAATVRLCSAGSTTLSILATISY